MATSDSNESDFIEVSWNVSKLLIRNYNLYLTLITQIMESNRQPPIKVFKIELEYDNKTYNVTYSVTNHAHIFPIKNNYNTYLVRLIAENAKGRSFVSKRICKY